MRVDLVAVANAVKAANALGPGQPYRLLLPGTGLRAAVLMLFAGYGCQIHIGVLSGRNCRLGAGAARWRAERRSALEHHRAGLVRHQVRACRLLGDARAAL